MEKRVMIRCTQPRERAVLIIFYIVLYTASVTVLLLSGLHCIRAYGDEKGYTIQLGAYQDVHVAQEKVNELKRFGHNVSLVKESTEGNRIWYRIYIEQFSSKEAAEREARVLKELGLISDYIIRYLSSENGCEKDNKDKVCSAFYLHVGSFKNAENAETLVRTIKKEDQNALKVREEVSGEHWYRVYIGSYEDESEAKRAGSQLKKKGLISGFRTLRMEKAPSADLKKRSKP
jgi:cell division protein FtsN